jgi:hypothetical protein
MANIRLLLSGVFVQAANDPTEVPGERRTYGP